MGIPGLTKFVNDHSDRFLRPYQLKDTYLVLDGSNISCNLYKWYTKSLSAFGGDYDLYSVIVRQFFTKLLKCNVKPIVIFDGGHEEKKLKTVHKRTMEVMEMLFNFNRKCWKGVFFPLLLTEVFCSVLEELDVPQIQCFFEADREIAAVAKHFNCPVLSYDSDFYLFEVLYIPFDTLDLNLKESDTGCHLQCFIYDVDVFLEEFKGFDRSLLPLVAALLGNDYVDRNVFHKFFNHVLIPHKSNRSCGQSRISGLMNWLSNEPPDFAVNHIISHIKKSSVNSAMKAIKMTMDDYKITEPVILPLLNQEKSQKSLFCTDHELIIRLPERFIELYQKCKLNRILIDMIYLKRYYVKIQVEDVTKQSSQTISFPIMSAIHKIMNGFIDESSELVLYAKKFKHYSKSVLQHPVENCFAGIDLKNIFTESKEAKIKILYSVLSMSELDIDILGNFDAWILFMICMIFWLKNATVTSSHLQSILMMAIANYVQSRVGYYKNYSCFMKYKAGAMNRLSKRKVDEINSDKNSLSAILESINEIELLKFTQKFIKLRQNEPETTSNGYFISTIHLFAAFQSVLLHVSLLNALMDFPFPKIKFSDFYSGTFLYNLYYILNKKPNSANFLLRCLSEVPNIKTLYEYLLEKLTPYTSPKVKTEKPTRFEPFRKKKRH